MLLMFGFCIPLALRGGLRNLGALVMGFRLIIGERGLFLEVYLFLSINLIIDILCDAINHSKNLKKSKKVVI